MLRDFDVPLNLSLARQHQEEVRREVSRIRLGRMAAADPAKARRHFFRMFWIRKFLFRLSSRLAYKLLMKEDSCSDGGARNHGAP